MQEIMVAVWTAVFIGMLILEVMTMGLVSIWFAAGALAALIGAACGLIFPMQLAIFFVTSGLLLAFLFPVVRNQIKAKATATNADRIIGAEGVVIEAIDEIRGTGQIRVMGAVWSAKSAHLTSIEAGEKVVVKSIAGVKAVVVRKEHMV